MVVTTGHANVGAPRSLSQRKTSGGVNESESNLQHARSAAATRFGHPGLHLLAARKRAMPSAHKAFRLARTSDRIASTIAEFRFLSRRLPQLFRGGGGGLTAEKAAAMNLALNNATNVTKYYKDLGEKVKVEVITFGPGLHMLRADTSPV